jgi:hypothetical protein
MDTEWDHGHGCVTGGRLTPKGWVVLTALVSREEHGLCGVATHSLAVCANEGMRES